MRRLLCLGLFLSVLVWSGPAWALSVASTDAYLDWSSLTISGRNGFQWPAGNQYTYLRADARNDLQDIEGIPATHFDQWGGYGVVTSTEAPMAVGTAETGQLTVSTFEEDRTFDGLLGSTRAETDGSTTTTAHAAANVRRTSDVYVLPLLPDSDPLTLDFAIDYYIFHDFFTTETGEDADVYTEMHFRLGEGDNAPQASVIVDQFMEAGVYTGTLAFSATFTSGDLYCGLQGDIWTWADAYSPAQTAPVPEPSTMVLMGFGLMGLVGMGRKRLKN